MPVGTIAFQWWLRNSEDHHPGTLVLGPWLSGPEPAPLPALSLSCRGHWTLSQLHTCGVQLSLGRQLFQLPLPNHSLPEAGSVTPEFK